MYSDTTHLSSRSRIGGLGRFTAGGLLGDNSCAAGLAHDAEGGEPVEEPRAVRPQPRLKV